MRKNDLIKLLQELPGNPEVVLWNGFVGDYHPISTEISELELVKHSRDYLRWRCASPGEPELSDEEVERLFKREEWGFPNQFIDAERAKEWYGRHRKKLFVLTGEARGKTHWDRLGTMSY